MKLLLSQIDLDFFHDVGTSEDEYEKYQRYYKHKIKEMKDEIPILVRWFYSRRSHVDNCIGVHRRVNFKEMKELVDFINNQVPGISLGFLLDDFAGDIQTQPKDKPNNMEKQEKATQIKTSHEGE
jgi:F0F1-type ATP synthase assembly protein I